MSTLTKKSDTHQERYYHFVIENHERISRATVFARMGDWCAQNPPIWWATVAFCSKKDQYCKQTGRNVARRKFFNFAKAGDFGKNISSYEKAKEFAINKVADL